MDMKMGTPIPFFDFTKDPKSLEEGSEEWKDLCDKVREACEEYGCFQVAYNKIPAQLSGEIFKALKDLFDLPLETKMKNFSPRPHFGYVPTSERSPFYETLGIDDVPMLRDAQAFTNLMWPEGNPSVCETLNSVSTKMRDLELLIRKMVMESYGVGKYFKANVESSRTVFRLIKYTAPVSSPNPTKEDSPVVGLVPHTDKGLITLVSQHEVQGLQVLTKQGDWVPVAPIPNTFTVFFGDSFMAWSNGRLHAAKHRVMMSGDKDRYSYTLFVTPKEGAMVEVPQELVDQDHPLRFRPFNYMDYLHYVHSNYKEKALEIYAGV